MTPDWAATAEPIPYATLDDPQSMNLYSYVVNNPLRNTDTDGHSLHAFPVYPMDYDPFANSAAEEGQDLQAAWDQEKEQQRQAQRQSN
jgi:hypothetical protein